MVHSIQYSVGSIGTVKPRPTQIFRSRDDRETPVCFYKPSRLNVHGRIRSLFEQAVIANPQYLDFMVYAGWIAHQQKNNAKLAA